MEKVKVYFSSGNPISRSGDVEIVITPKNFDEVWWSVDELGLSVFDFGMDENGHYLIFSNRNDAVRFKLSVL